jgi:hypothetical protein
MDIKSKLEKMVFEESERIAAESHRKSSFEGQQRRAFEAIRQPLKEIVEAAGAAIIRFNDYDHRATLMVKGSGSSVISYEVEPNSLGKYSSSPSPKAGFEVRMETQYNNSMVRLDPTIREYVLPSSDAVIEDLMKILAEAIASSR